MIFSSSEIAQIVSAIEAQPNGLLFRETSSSDVYAVNIVAGTKRHITAGQQAVMTLAGIKPLVIGDGLLSAYTTVTA